MQRRLFFKYPFNISTIFNSTAFQIVKQIHPNLKLDKFYITQLHEYEPILQVQHTLTFGNCCSRELRSKFLKRKTLYDDLTQHPTKENGNNDIIME